MFIDASEKTETLLSVSSCQNCSNNKIRQIDWQMSRLENEIAAQFSKIYLPRLREYALTAELHSCLSIEINVIQTNLLRDVLKVL